ncbi:hypothetical protein C8R47DRAFT_1078966 [Mycena vitilis]|nr:hypothetical protein C8R47DRAFT_1078966 [Mycena vitilis]
MSAWTPLLLLSFSETLRARPPVSTDLKNLHDQRSRQKRLECYEQLTDKLLSDKVWPGLLWSWGSSATGLDVKEVPLLPLIETFLDVQLAILDGDHSSAIARLAHLQRQIQYNEFGHVGLVQGRQRNPVLEHDLDGDPSSEYEDSGDEADEEMPEATTACLSFEKIDSQPIRGRDKALWNRRLLAAPDAWPGKIQWWVATLENAITSQPASLTLLESDDESILNPRESRNLYRSVVTVLREVKDVRPNIFQQREWRKQVQAQGFHTVVKKICQPYNTVFWSHPHIQELHSKNRIQDLLAVVLQRWTPPDVVSTWTSRLVSFGGAAEIQLGGKTLGTGKELIKALQEHTCLIPRASYPQAIFFALGLPNFTYIWNAYMGPGLYALGFRYLSHRTLGAEGPGLGAIQDPGLRIILVRTLEYKALQKAVNSFAYQHKPRDETKFVPNQQTHDSPRKPKQLPHTLDYCQFCVGLTTDECCVQRIPVRDKVLDKSVIGCAISKAPPEECRAPIPPKVKFNSDGSPKKPPEVLHPDDPRLQIRFFKEDEARLKRCGRHLLLFVDADTDAVRDFYLYGAFADDVMARMLQHHEDLTGIKPLTRGGQFDWFTSGEMIGVGPRVATGGGPADALRLYEGMEARSAAGLNALFNHAEDTLIVQETARAVFPQLIQQRNQVMKNCDKLGQVGTTLYDCDNFATRIHLDPDAGHISLSLSEFAFVHVEWGVAIEPRSNALWSFDSRKFHGCVLPSTRELTRADCGPGEPYQRRRRAQGEPEHGAGGGGPERASIGRHDTATEGSVSMAERYQDAREMAADREAYWDGDV